MIKKKTKNKISGMTLIEMIMAIAVFVIGIEGFTLLFIKTWKTNSYALELGQSSLAASQGVNRMADYIRRARQGDNGSYPVVSGQDNELTIYCDYDKDGVTERLHFYKIGQDIFMGITHPTQTIPKTYPSGDQESKKLATNVVNDESATVFEYYDKDYPLDNSNNPIDTPILVSQARLVKIYLEVDTDPNRLPESVKIRSFVEMRNLNDYNQFQ